MPGTMMTMRATHKRAAREAFDRDELYSDDTFALSDENISEDEACRYQARSRSPDEAERMSSPKSAMDMHMVFNSPKKPAPVDYSNDEFAEKRVTIWNWREQRKLSGNSAPFKKNLQEYLRKHPDWEEYVGQDKDENGKKNFVPKKRRKDVKLNDTPKADVVRTNLRGASIPMPADMSGLINTDARRRVADAPTRHRVQAEAEAAWRHAKQEAAKQKEQEEKEACRWREFSAIQHIIDHYNQGPAKSPFVGDNAMMNA
jgi:hypothetical protein